MIERHIVKAGSIISSVAIDYTLSALNIFDRALKNCCALLSVVDTADRSVSAASYYEKKNMLIIVPRTSSAAVVEPRYV
jgi:hypothetical protein